MDKRLAAEIPGDQLGEEFKGYIFKLTGGNDKQGFPMKQGVLVPHRVRLLLSKGQSCFKPRRDGERKRKSVRGCIVSHDISVVSLVVLKKGDQEIPGVTDVTVPKRLGPKRASKIRRLFNLSKEDNVFRYVFRRTIPAKVEGGKIRSKAPKIQRLVTPARIQRKRKWMQKKTQRREISRQAAKDYRELVAAKRRQKMEEKTKK